MSIYKKFISTALIALVIGIGLGYAGAIALRPITQVQQTSSKNLTGVNRGSVSFDTHGGRSSGFLSGVVSTKDSESVTVNTSDGNSHVILITPETNISKDVSGSMNDISVGSVVIVSGTTNGDGSVSAKFIQLRPANLSGTTQ